MNREELHKYMLFCRDFGDIDESIINKKKLNIKDTYNFLQNEFYLNEITNKIIWKKACIKILLEEEFFVDNYKLSDEIIIKLLNNTNLDKNYFNERIKKII